MSDSRTGRSPRTKREWEREITQRTRRLENADTVRIGSWVLSEQDGELVATRPGRRVVLTAQFAEDESTAGQGRSVAVFTVQGTPTGVWRIVYRGDPTGDLALTATPAQVLAAVLALNVDYTALDFDVTGPNGGPWRLVHPGGTVAVDPSGLSGDGGVAVT